MADKWVSGAVKRPGQLHRDLHIPQGQPIGAARIEAATHSSNPKIRQRANFAKTARSFKR